MVRTIAVVALGLFVLSGCGRPRTPEERWERGAEWAVSKISRELDLTQDQKTSLERIAADVKSKQVEVRSLTEGIHEEIASAFASDTFDKERLNRVLAEKEETIRSLRSFAVDKAAEFHALLTPEQRSEVASRLEKMRGHH